MADDRDDSVSWCRRLATPATFSVVDDVDVGWTAGRRSAAFYDGATDYCRWNDDDDDEFHNACNVHLLTKFNFYGGFLFCKKKISGNSASSNQTAEAPLSFTSNHHR